jgi:hypothetical protein
LDRKIVDEDGDILFTVACFRYNHVTSSKGRSTWDLPSWYLNEEDFTYLLLVIFEQRQLDLEKAVRWT